VKTKRIFALIVALVLILSTLTYATETTDVTTNEDTVGNAVQTEIMPRTSEVEENDDTTDSDEIVYVDPETGEEYGISLLEETDNENAISGYIDGDFYKADDVIDLASDVNGNVFVMGETLNITNAYISGDVFAIAEKINITNSTITGTVFAITNNLNYSDSYSSDIYAIAKKATFDEGTYLYRDVKILGNEINLAGRITRNANISANVVTIAEETEILGKLDYSAESETTIPESASIAEYKFSQNSYEENEAYEDFDAMSVFISAIVFLIKVAIISGFLLIYSNNFRKVNKNETKNSAKKIAKFAGNGIILLIVVPIIAIVLALTIVGIGLGVALIGIYAILLYCATAIASLSIAMFILKDKENSKLKIWGTSLIVALAIWLLEKIPYIGVIFKFVAIVIGLGVAKATIFYKKNYNKNDNKEELSTVDEELNKEEPSNSTSTDNFEDDENSDK
jgi:hypothetical protein